MLEFVLGPTFFSTVKSCWIHPNAYCQLLKFEDWRLVLFAFFLDLIFGVIIKSVMPKQVLSYFFCSLHFATCTRQIQAVSWTLGLKIHDKSALVALYCDAFNFCCPTGVYLEKHFVFASCPGLAVHSWIWVMKSVMPTCVLSWFFFCFCDLRQAVFSNSVWKFSIGFANFVLCFFVLCLWCQHMPYALCLKLLSDWKFRKTNLKLFSDLCQHIFKKYFTN